MYNRLVQTLPDLVVLPQVSFGALLTARTRAARSSFSRKIADFVVCDRSFKVVAVVALGDKNSKGKSQRDLDRDALLVEAGYRVLRYPRVPDVGRVEADFDPTMASVNPMGS
jgi:very-short-patch-repair endonuclease